VADPDKAEPMAAYMKGRFTFIGVSAGERRKVSKDLIREAKHAEPDWLIDVAQALWDQPQRELHYIGMDVLRAGSQNLRASDLDAIAGLITKTPWWDTVDSLAAWTVGPMVMNHPELVGSMDRWIESDDLWLARTAILHQLGYKERTDAARLFGYAARRAEDTDFFIRKAIGWALRQYARVQPDAVARFVAEHVDQLSGLTKREALKHLS
jgi:3-methyladenine DNA glycosylase AlkD